MFFGISQRYTIYIYEFYFEEYMLGYLSTRNGYMHNGISGLANGLKLY